MPTVPMDDLLRLVCDEDASDLHLSVDAPPALRIRGSLVKLSMPPLSSQDTETLARSIASDYHFERLQAEGSVDFAFSFRGENRFRVSLYRQKGCLSVALRLIPRRMLAMSEIGLPEIVSELLKLPRGLVLLTGPTGSGKTTSLASILNVIGQTRKCHIITIEDPIEYMLTHQEGIVDQREIGMDVPSFAEGLRRALRQDPDVILVGEMRDLETMEIAMTAAETGHLVLSSVHTTGAARTVDRIVDAFPSDKQEQIRVQLAGNLKAAISQILIPRLDGKGRVAAFEVMVNTPSVSAMIRDNKSFRIPSDILTGSKYGMVALESSLVNLYQKGVISRDEVLSKSQDPLVARQLMGEPV